MIASIVVDVAAETVVWPSDGNWAITTAHVFSLLAERGSVRIIRASHFTPFAWQYADDARLSLSPFKSCGAVSRCLKPPHLVCTISHRRNIFISPLSTNANLFSLLVRRFDESSKADMIYQGLIARRRIRHRQAPVRPVLSHGSHGVVEDAS